MPQNKTSKQSYRAEPVMDKHAVGGAVGAALGTAAGIAGVGAIELAAAGAVAGPIGLVAGAAVGAALGGQFGKDIAYLVNPTAEEEYWRDNYHTRGYVVEGADYETYRPAYRYGIDAYSNNKGRQFDEVEGNLSREWESKRGGSTLDWSMAKPAVRDAYDRLFVSDSRRANKI